MPTQEAICQKVLLTLQEVSKDFRFYHVYIWFRNIPELRNVFVFQRVIIAHDHTGIDSSLQICFL